MTLKQKLLWLYKINKVLWRQARDFRSQVPITIDWFELETFDMQDKLHYFNPLHRKCVQTHLRSQKNLELSTIVYGTALKREFSVNTGME